MTLGPNVDWAGAFDATTTFAAALTIGVPTGGVTLAPSDLPVRPPQPLTQPRHARALTLTDRGRPFCCAL